MAMIQGFIKWLLLVCACALLQACGGGGGNSSQTTLIITPGATSNGASLNYTQTTNNLPLVVDSGPTGGGFGNANMLYATLTLCVPGNASACVTIDHLQVDTGSIGLRVLASKVSSLGLPANQVSAGQTLHECYPFVIGGLWGPGAVADVGMGPLWARRVPIQLIQDNAQAAVQAPSNCVSNVNGKLLTSVASLGSNGILGIGNVAMDCGLGCISGVYGSFVQYYNCPPTASSNAACTPAAVPTPFQTGNPVVAIEADANNVLHNNGTVVSLPAVDVAGATSVHGELILGLNTHTNNQLPSGAQPLLLGTNTNNGSGGLPDSYLSITTLYKGQLVRNSYLDTGSNGIFFQDSSIALCSDGSGWYCPASTLDLSAVLSDGDTPGQHASSVNFKVGNAMGLDPTRSAYITLAGNVSLPNSSVFAWGLPFFYGRRVYQSIWQQPGSINGPWYWF